MDERMIETLAVCSLFAVASICAAWGIITGIRGLIDSYREKNRLSPGVEELIRQGLISKRPESRKIDSTFLAHVARQLDHSKAPEHFRNTYHQVYFSGGPIDGVMGLYPSFVTMKDWFLVAVHRRQDRFAVYSQISESINWEGCDGVKVWHFKFERYVGKKESDELILKMSNDFLSENAGE